MRRVVLSVVIAAVIVVLITLVGMAAKNPSEEALIIQAKTLYSQSRKDGFDMANGPCLGSLVADWAVDVVHEPRQAIDDQEGWNCEEFITGKVKNLIELDPNGNFLRIIRNN